MNTSERRMLLASRLAATGEVSFADAAAMFEVSVMTIRRDAEALELQGVARRVPNGMMSTVAYEPPFSSRVMSQAHQKEDIARAAAALLGPGECVLIDSGSTALAVAHAIRGRALGLTVITPSLLVAMELSDEPETPIILPGGELRPGEMSLVGPETIASFKNYNIDTFIMGVGGIDAHRGISDYNRSEAAKKRTGIAAAHRVIACVDASKLGRSYIANVASLADVHTIVTDGNADDPAVQAARAAGVDVLLVTHGSL